MVSNSEARAIGYVDKIHYKHYPYMSEEEYKKWKMGMREDESKLIGECVVVTPDGIEVLVKWKTDRELCNFLRMFKDKGFKIVNDTFRMDGEFSDKYHSIFVKLMQEVEIID